MSGMRELVDGVLYDTEGAQFVAGYRARRGRGGGGSRSRLETGAMYVLPGPGAEKRIFMIERPATGEASLEPVDAGTARVVVDEWQACGRISDEAARMALATLDMVAPVPDSADVRPAASGGGREAKGT